MAAEMKKHTESSDEMNLHRNSQYLNALELTGTAAQSQMEAKDHRHQ